MTRRVTLAIATVLFLAVVGLLGWQNIPEQDDARISATESSGISLSGRL
jgi:hypothetical protein